MALEREPSVLRTASAAIDDDRADTVVDDAVPRFDTVDPPPIVGADSEANSVAAGRTPSASKGRAASFFVAGFWRRLGGGLIDLAIILPISAVLAWLAGLLSGVHLPASRHHGIDFWLDLMLANDPAFVGGIGLMLAVAAIYLLVFQGVLGRTLGMRAVKTRIIDVYGDPPSMARAGARSAGYMVCLATLGLGFVWVAFDAEKRGLHDWISGTYVVKT